MEPNNRPRKPVRNPGASSSSLNFAALPELNFTPLQDTRDRIALGSTDSFQNFANMSISSNLELGPYGLSPAASRRSRNSNSKRQSGSYEKLSENKASGSQSQLFSRTPEAKPDRGTKTQDYALDGRSPDQAYATYAQYSETLTIKTRQLTVLDVACLILNKMVGTGIFTTPGYVLSLTNGKGLSLFLWGLGGVYAALCLVIYLDYGTAMPFNGGELIYFNKVWGKPKLLSAVLFSGYFISLGHTSGNSIAFARQVILASQPPGVPEDGTQLDDSVFDSRLVNFIALAVLGAVCLLHYFTKRLGLFLNRVSAFYKVALLFLVAFLAFGVRIPHVDFEWQDKSPSNFKAFDSVAGFIYITYSYSGWENANYVIGELQAKPRTFHLGAFTALSIVTLGYVLVTLGYFLACSTLSIQNGADLGMAMILAPKFKINGGHIGLQVCIAISAFGNLIADVYTSCRVKQAIALHNIIPFSKFFAADSKSFGTPGGALLLHWILSAIVIVSIPSTSDGYGFVVGLFTYGQLGIGVFMGVLYYTLDKGIGPEQGWNPLLQGKWPKVIAGFTLAIVNIMILVVAALPSNAGEIPRWMWSVTLAGVFGSSVVYWCVLKAFGGWFGKKIGWSATVKAIKHDNDFQQMEHEHRRDGTKQRYEWTRGSKDDRLLVRWAQKVQRGAKWVGKYI